MQNNFQHASEVGKSQTPAKSNDTSQKEKQKIVDPMKQSLDEPNAGLEPAASRLEVSRATLWRGQWWFRMAHLTAEP